MFERSVGDFMRTFKFPTGVDQEKVNASMENGILSISVPKAGKAKDIGSRLSIRALDIGFKLYGGDEYDGVALQSPKFDGPKILLYY